MAQGTANKTGTAPSNSLDFHGQSTKGRLIAVDMDDVLCLTADAVTSWHNAVYGTQMGMHDMQYYLLWKNEHWGTPGESLAKIRKFQETGYGDLKPVPGSLEALEGLRSLGFRLIVLTARSHEHEEVTREWVNRYLPGIFEEIILTSNFVSPAVNAVSGNPWAGKSKAEVIKAKGADLLIDDALENAMVCASQGIHVLLFGDYAWSTRHGTTTGPLDLLSRKERIEAGDDGYWEREVVTPSMLSEMAPNVRRVSGWEEVVEWVRKRYDEEEERALEDLGDEVPTVEIPGRQGS